MDIHISGAVIYNLSKGISPFRYGSLERIDRCEKWLRRNVTGFVASGSRVGDDGMWQRVGRSVAICDGWTRKKKKKAKDIRS